MFPSFTSFCFGFHFTFYFPYLQLFLSLHFSFVCVYTCVSCPVTGVPSTPPDRDHSRPGVAQGSRVLYAEGPMCDSVQSQNCRIPVVTPEEGVWQSPTSNDPNIHKKKKKKVKGLEGITPI